ncbi:MAG: colanic acid biosynthesis glycosyltransferase WcaL [Chloroflexi bacterium]|nr:MAG: colanic acid biosynthesis glycosyltransferase WcaL [Chloroflexota bacterium]
MDFMMLAVTPSSTRLVLILSGFPRRSETFALNEALALQASGLLAAIFATKPGDNTPPHPDARHLLPHVRYLPAGTPYEQARFLAQALAHIPVTGIHAYFAHLPAQVAELAAEMLAVPFGFSVHARDARKISTQELQRRARAAQCVVACNRDVAEELAGSNTAVSLLPHGVDTSRFLPQPFPPVHPLQLLAVGRLVEKKGFDVLLTAVSRLSHSFHLRIVGEGPQREYLTNLIHSLGLSRQVTLCGSKTHADLPDFYAAAHIVVVPSVVDSTGDRDGLPNVVLEAMACGRPVVASRVGAIPSAVIHNKTGYLVPSGVPEALANQLNNLATQPNAWIRMGTYGRWYVEQQFSLKQCTDRFCEHLRTAYAPRVEDTAVFPKPLPRKTV